MWSGVSCFNFQYLLISLKSSSSCLRFLLHVPVTSVIPSKFPSIMWFRKQFLPQIWPIQLAFLHFPICRMFLSSWLFVILLHFSHDQSNWSSAAAHFETFSVCLIYCVKSPSSSTVQSHVISCIMLHWPLSMYASCRHMATSAVVWNLEGKRTVESGKAQRTLELHHTLAVRSCGRSALP